MAVSNLANARAFDGWMTESEYCAASAVAILEELYAASAGSSLELRNQLLRVKNNLGKFRYLAGAYHKAEVALADCQRLSMKLVGDNPRVPDYLHMLAEANLALGSVHTAQGRTAAATRILDEGLAYEQKVLQLNPIHTQGLKRLPEHQLARVVLERECGRLPSASHLIDEALPLLTAAHLEHPDHQGDMVDLFEGLVASALLDAKIGRSTAAGRITEIHRLFGVLHTHAGNDPKNVWSASEAVWGYLALAERALVLASPTEALEFLGKASSALEPAGQTAPGLLVLQSHATRLEALRGEALRRIGKHAEAAAAAKRAVEVAEPLAREDPAYLYDLTCACALQARLDPAASGPPAAAVGALRAAINEGFDNVHKLEHDDRLAPLRLRNDFQALIRAATQKATAPAGANEAPSP
jgi:tetratricopeptide (TPR) repeat protein